MGGLSRLGEKRKEEKGAKERETEEKKGCGGSDRWWPEATVYKGDESDFESGKGPKKKIILGHRAARHGMSRWDGTTPRTTE
jgi:hypothetical protein